MSALPQAALITVADAIVEELNNGTWCDGIEFEAVRKYVIRRKLKELVGTLVAVVPATEVRERVARGLKEYTCEIDVGVQQKIAINSDTEIAEGDAVFSLAEAFANYFEDKHLAEEDDIEAQCIGGAKVALWDDEHLEEFGVMTCVVRLTVLIRVPG